VEENDFRLPVSEVPCFVTCSLCVPARASCGSRYVNEVEIDYPKVDESYSPHTNSTLKPTFGDLTEAKALDVMLDADQESFATDTEVARFVLDRVYTSVAELIELEHTQVDSVNEEDLAEPVTEGVREAIVREILQEIYESIEAAQVEGSNDESLLAVASENPTQAEII